MHGYELVLQVCAEMLVQAFFAIRNQKGKKLKLKSKLKKLNKRCNRCPLVGALGLQAGGCS